MTETHNETGQTGAQPWVDWLLLTRAADSDRKRRGRMTAAALLVLILVTLLLLPMALLDVLVLPSPVILLVLGVAWFGLYLLNRRGRVDAASVLAAVALLAGSLLVVAASGPVSVLITLLVLPIIAAGLLGPPVSAFGLAILAGLSYFLLNIILNRGEVAFELQNILLYLNFLLIGMMTWVFSRTTQRALIESQETSLALVFQREETIARLDAQTRYLQATITVARSLVGSRNLDELLDNTVDLVRDTFGYYHVQVFLVDEARNYALLRQSTGEAGRQLLARGHRLPVGSMSVIGQVTVSGQPVIARDTDSDVVHRRNELLPDTRSEMAIPLRIGDEIIGALDLQSVESDAFAPDVIPTLQALADQLAIAIQNARLFEQAETSLRELRELSEEAAYRSWAEFIQETKEVELRQSFGAETPELSVQRSRVVDRVLTSGSVIISTGKDDQPAFLAVPVVVRNQVVGVLGVEPDGMREWTRDDLNVLEGIAERTALAVENARLYIEARRAAEREHLITNISDRLQRAPSLAMLLQSAAEELAAALGTDNVYAEISISKPFSERRRDVQGAEGSDKPELAPPADAAEEARAEL